MALVMRQVSVGKGLGICEVLCPSCMSDVVYWSRTNLMMYIYFSICIDWVDRCESMTVGSLYRYLDDVELNNLSNVSHKANSSAKNATHYVAENFGCRDFY